jgi:hypothetical protein
VYGSSSLYLRKESRFKIFGNRMSKGMFEPRAKDVTLGRKEMPDELHNL